MNIRERLRQLPWQEIENSLWQFGYAKTPPLLTPKECDSLIALYPNSGRFRSRVEMRRFRFGEGDYQYFNYPLPQLVQQIRTHSYPPLAQVANKWVAALGLGKRYPEYLKPFIDACRQVGQTKPTPLLLHYEEGGYNCLHQDLYGELAFPLQATCFLSQPGRDYSGGEFLLVEQRPRAQSIGHAIHAEQGEILFFTTRFRPVKGSRGYYRTTLRHGVSIITSGRRYTLGIIFHDAK